LIIAQAVPSEHAEQLLAQRCPLTGLTVRQRLVAAFLANSLWLPVFNNERYYAALAIMAVYLGFLLSVYSDLNVATTQSFLQAVSLTVGLAMNTSWIIVAFMASLFFCAGEVGWKDEHGVAGSVPAAFLALLIVAGLACWRVWAAHDFAWAFVGAWAARGIFRMQTVPDRVRFPLAAMSASLGQFAWLCSIVVIAVMAATAGFVVYSQAVAAKLK